MGHESTFASLLAGARTGDEQAAAELQRTYEPQVRRYIRVRWTDPALRRQLDSEDICQSVMAHFFVGLSLGQFEIQSPTQLCKLLVTMARNRLIKHAKKERAARRDVRRREPVAIDQLPLANDEPTPSQALAQRELLQQFFSRLTPDERKLAEASARGRTWQELAREWGVAPDALRMRHVRAVRRVARELGLEESFDARPG